MTTHTPECLAQMEKARKEREDYITKWPNYCKSCNGWGGSTEYQTHPYGSTTASEPIFEPCSDCGAAHPRCPRCGEDAFLDEGIHMNILNWLLEGEPCPSCGYDWGNNPDDALPDEPECLCNFL